MTPTGQEPQSLSSLKAPSPPPSPSLCWVDSSHSPEEDVIALFSDVGPETQELAVDPVQDGLKVLSLPGILTVKQLQELWGQESGETSTPGSSYPTACLPRAPLLYTPPSLRSPHHHQDKLLIHISLGHRGLEVWALQETQEKLIHQLGEGHRQKR